MLAQRPSPMKQDAVVAQLLQEEKKPLLQPPKILRVHSTLADQVDSFDQSSV
jgi:hypothetical protein